MTEITAAMVRELREATHVGMMECKKALVEAGGDRDKAVTLLRERGLATAAKKSVRAAQSGAIAGRPTADGRAAALVEVNCETDFVARNEMFQAFAKTVLDRALAGEEDLAQALREETVAQVAKIGENLVVRRSLRFQAGDAGVVGVYIHPGGRVGVMVEAACGRAETRDREAFRALVHDLALHVAACSPAYLDRAAVPESVISAERAIFAKQVEGKPENIVEKIVTGKLEKTFSQICLLEQGFVKDPDVRVDARIAAVAGELGDSVAVRRFARWQLGEAT